MDLEQYTDSVPAQIPTPQRYYAGGVLWRGTPFIAIKMYNKDTCIIAPE